MIFGVVIVNLILYCAQQLGVSLGLGAETIMLVAFVSAMKDGVVDEREAQFLRATRNVMWVSLVLIVVSGIGITALHLLAGQAATVMTPAYLFKILLIAAVITLTALLHKLPETFAEGLLGGTWYALFLVHILAPVTSWANLITLLVVWLVGFNAVWYVIAQATREKGLFGKPAVKSSEALVLEKSAGTPFAKSKAPALLQQIRLDPVPRTPPKVVPEALAPVEVKVPIEPQKPAQQIKTDAAPAVMRQALPIEKLPANRATDTPFLPQVPPLSPIPVIMPTTATGAGTAAVAVPIPAAGIPKAPDGSPMLQKPEELQPAVPPEIKLGLNVMPKSPEQIKP